MSWQAVARQMPSGWTLAAPDLRGRGHSAHLPGPYGLERHASRRDRGAAAFRRTAGAGRAFDGRVRRAARPRRAPETGAGGSSWSTAGCRCRCRTASTWTPRSTRPWARPSPGWGRRSRSTEAYLDFWRAHPALAGHWTADVEAYVRYDLAGEPASCDPVPSRRRSALTAARCWRTSRSRTRSAG